MINVKTLCNHLVVKFTCIKLLHRRCTALNMQVCCLKFKMGNDLTVQNWMIRFQILMAINEQLIVDVYRREVSVFIFLDTSSLLVISDMAMECLCLKVCVRVSSLWYKLHFQTPNIMCFYGRSNVSPLLPCDEIQTVKSERSFKRSFRSVKRTCCSYFVCRWDLVIWISF